MVSGERKELKTGIAANEGSYPVLNAKRTARIVSELTTIRNTPAITGTFFLTDAGFFVKMITRAKEVIIKLMAVTAFMDSQRGITLLSCGMLSNHPKRSRKLITITTITETQKNLRIKRLILC